MWQFPFLEELGRLGTTVLMEVPSLEEIGR
jgi:hypothetical protein